MEWKRMGPWCLVSGPWRIAKALVDGRPIYTLTRDGDEDTWCRVRVARGTPFASAAEAMQAAEERERAEALSKGAGDGAD